MKILSLSLALICLSLGVWGQTFTQTIRGNVSDVLTNAPLVGAQVVILDSDPLKGAYTDEYGDFRIEDVPIGRQSIAVSYLGFLDQVISQVQVNTGKETVLNILMEESVRSVEEVVISASKAKGQALNEMSTVSARSFNLEETGRYAGSRNDPARMASNFAGVSGANDSRNDIIIRGNSPTGLLWRLEGVNIPNPSHFGATGATGGPVSMLNNNVLARSDFMTGAFPAQYGNAVAGVFDLNMRNGNNQQHEFLGQIGFNGFELGAEGPFSKKSKASHLINYRYSTLGVFKALGVDFGTGTAVPEYQDLTFKVDVPTKKWGRFSLFGVGGVSAIDLLSSESDTSLTDLFSVSSLDIRPRYRTGILGANHKILLGPKTAQTITLAASHAWEATTIDAIDPQTQDPTFVSGALNRTNTYSLVYQLSHKFNAKNNIRVGAYLDTYDYEFRDSALTSNQMFTLTKNSDGRTLLSQVYVQWQHRFTDQLVLNTGLNFMHLALNDDIALEPRVGLRYQFGKGSMINLGYGLHNQRAPLPIYFLQSTNANNEVELTNQSLGFTQSQHVVLGYDQQFGSNFRLKLESYIQFLDNVPVDPFPSSFSLLNAGADFVLPGNTYLVNEGTGRNVGIELTLEKFFSQNYYLLFTTSIFDSKYTGSDNVTRNTTFNGQYVVNALAGKEFPIGKSGRYTATIDWKMTLAGGRYVIPIDLEASIAQGREVLQNELAFSEQLSDYFRTDLKVGFRMNRQKFTQEFSVDIQNLTDRANVFSRSFNPSRGTISIENQLGLFVVPQYRILF